MSEEAHPDPKRRKTSSSSLSEIALAAVANFPASDVEIGLAFVAETVPTFARESNDRLVKVGRNVKSLVDMRDDLPSLEDCLGLQVQECEWLSHASKDSNFLRVPKVRFGKTNLQMPILTLGCMRFQQKWGTVVTNMNQVYSDCQDNLVAILRRSVMEFGMNHIETARGYGCSELQLGVAFKQLFAAGEIKREDLIIQTKVGPTENPNEFREMLESSFKNLQVDYLDLFAFHGLNGDWQWEWMFREGQENCWSIIQEYKAEGKIRFIGFSTHGPTDFITKLIETNKFDYVNLHHHFVGSYTATGDGPGHVGNITCLRKMKERDMGAFIISPCDKGGKLYAPCQKLRNLTLPDCEPMTYGLGWLWTLHEHDPHKAEVHTVTIGAARPSDLDQVAVAAHLHSKGEMLAIVKTVSERLKAAQVDALGQEWLESCFMGVVKSTQSKYLVEHNQIVWLYNCLKAWGMLEFCKDRFQSFVTNQNNSDSTLASNDETIDKIGRRGWGFTPGLVPNIEQDYFADDLAAVPEKNRARLKEAYEFVVKWCSPKPEQKCLPGETEELDEEMIIPKEYQTSLTMKPWKDFPDRTYPY